MSYVTIKSFTDKNENSAEKPGAPKHVYWQGDKYPTKGGYVGATTKARLGELISGGFIERDDDDGSSNK